MSPYEQYKLENKNSHYRQMDILNSPVRNMMTEDDLDS